MDKKDKKYTPDKVQELEENEGTLRYVEINREVFSKTRKEKKKES